MKYSASAIRPAGPGSRSDGNEIKYTFLPCKLDTLVHRCTALFNEPEKGTPLAPHVRGTPSCNFKEVQEGLKT